MSTLTRILATLLDGSPYVESHHVLGKAELTNFQDVEPSRWHLDSHKCSLRRKVFWEIFTADKWRSLALGRPPMFPKAVVSCDLPEDDGPMESGGFARR